MLIMGRASAGRSQQLVCEYRDWYFFGTAEKNELFAAAIKTVFSKWETLSLKSVQKL